MPPVVEKNKTIFKDIFAFFIEIKCALFALPGDKGWHNAFQIRKTVLSDAWHGKLALEAHVVRQCHFFKELRC